jgi:membrane protein YdbS with pleckstrin-like domain
MRPTEPPATRPTEQVRLLQMLAFILLLILIWVILGIIGAVVHGLIWLLIIAAILFLATLVFGGTRIRGRR